MLRSAAGSPGLAYQRPPGPLGGGFWAELLSFSLADPPAGWPSELVARLMPDPDVALKETIVQRAVAAAGLLADAGGRVTVLDWSTALLGPRAYDVGFTSLLLSEPPLRVPGWQRPAVRAVGRLMARRFVRRCAR